VEVDVEAPSHDVPQEVEVEAPSQDVSREIVVRDEDMRELNKEDIHAYQSHVFLVNAD
ncbi:hypothetical protein Tco_0228400, partial [Tanacetum coccineum]